MHTRGDNDDDSLDEEYDDDREDPTFADQDSDDDADTTVCPFCGREVVEGADVCPKCGNFIGGSDDARKRIHPRWVILTAVVLLAAIAWAAVRWLW